MATTRQKELFARLTEDRNFGDKDVAALREQFATVSDRSASEWIEKALTLPKRDTSGDPHTPPPF